jgi:hypothetical protein
MGVTTTTSVGRANVLHPDYNHDSGTGLHAKLAAAFKVASDNMCSRWFDDTIIADTANHDFVHNFGRAITDLSYFIFESGALITEENKVDNYTITQTDINTINIYNKSGGSKTIELVILEFSIDKLMAKFYSTLTTTAVTTTNILTKSIASGKSCYAKAIITCRNSTNSNAYVIDCLVEESGGALNIINISKTQAEDTLAWDAAFDSSGTNLLVTVTGEAATTIKWIATLELNAR